MLQISKKSLTVWIICFVLVGVVPSMIAALNLSSLLKAEYKNNTKLEADKKELITKLTKTKEAMRKLELLMSENESEWLSSTGEATAYAPNDDRDILGGNSICSTGMIAGEHVFAVDPRIIPYYSKVIVLHKDGSVATGIAGDTGSAIVKPGKVRIDEFKNTYEEAMLFGRQEVTILWQPPTE